MILVIDNYDSFVFNLARHFERLGTEVLVLRHDDISVDEIRALRPEAIVFSPGPCTPDEAGCCLEVVRQFHAEIPMLGVCLGHQVIAQAFGGEIVRASEPAHGRASIVEHDGRGIFVDLPSPLVVGRYHSLVAEKATLPGVLEVSATTAEGLVMAVRHDALPVVGVQFHPESLLTEHGYNLLANFCRLAGMSVHEPIPKTEDELPAVVLPKPLPDRPVTF